MAWEWLGGGGGGLKNLLLGMDQEKMDAHMDEWYDYAKSPADRGEITGQEYQRRGGELLSEDVREGWHGRYPQGGILGGLGQFVLPALSAGYQLGQEGLRGLFGHQSYNKRGVGLLGNIGEMGLGLIGGAKDAIENIKGMAGAGQFDERFYSDKESGSTTSQSAETRETPEDDSSTVAASNTGNGGGKTKGNGKVTGGGGGKGRTTKTTKTTPYVTPYVGDPTGRTAKPDPFRFEDTKARAPKAPAPVRPGYGRPPRRGPHG